MTVEERVARTVEAIPAPFTSQMLGEATGIAEGLYEVLARHGYSAEDLEWGASIPRTVLDLVWARRR